MYGRLLLDFYRSGLVDQAAFEYKNLYLYGGFFDLVAAILEKIVPMWIWDLRHLLSAAFGLAGILAAYKISRTLAGERAAFICVVLLTITGAWTGSMFTHTKDIPFATCMLWALYYIIRIAPELPRPSLALTVKLGIAVGCALGLRIGAVFSVMYLCVIMLLADRLQSTSIKANIKFFYQSSLSLIPAALVAFALMALFWPWGVMSPSHPLEAARAFSHFAFNMLTVVDGKFVSIGDVPRDYLLEYLVVKLPEIILLGSACGLLVLVLKYKSLQLKTPKLLGYAAVGLAALFPLAFVLFTDPALYNGVRHFTFVVPPITILAAIGLHYTLDLLKPQPKWQATAIALFIAMTGDTAYSLYQLQPYEYVYYNHLAGNPALAESKWEGDYWSSSIREAISVLEARLAKEPNRNKPWLVAVCAESIQGSAYLDKRFKVTKDWVAADFYISSTNMHCDKVLKGKIIGTIQRMGAVLAVIKDRRELTGPDRIPHAAPRE